MPSPTPALLPDSVRSGLEERARSGRLELPVLRASAARVLALSQSADGDVREIARLIESDQALAGHVLRMSNAAAFAPREPIVSLQQAVARLGLSTLCEVTVAIVLKGSVFHIPGFESTLKELWRHSAATGAFAKEVARLLRKNVEGAFLCGLLHDVGKPVALKLLVEVCAQADVELDEDLAHAAMEHFHPSLGGLLVQQWGLSPWVAHAAEHHHDYRSAPDHRLESMVTCLADHLAHWALGTGDVAQEELASLQVVVDLGLYSDDVARLIAGRDRALDLAEAFA